MTPGGRYSPHELRSRSAHLAVQAASFVFTGVLAACALRGELLVGLLGVCLGFLVTRKLSGLSVRHKPPGWLAATIVIGTPLLLLVLLGMNARGLLATAFAQFPGLLRQMAKTVLELREKMPGGLAEYVPEGANPDNAPVKFLIEVAEPDGCYRQRNSLGNIAQAEVMWAGLNIGNGYKARLKRNGVIIAEKA